ncbi:uncharacterized protein LOC108112699 isoform X2 [Drosophila eugracilis]|uniref:uncharacterized protein LOC108112699 isoform X2 n=1 Tax=Drosophila eugracilis TaxID=29029 RepID=UPI0007E887E9|nr:uncharacterized protein LOC108112699 isoform X2 [Drosophila eugracilis]
MIGYLKIFLLAALLSLVLDPTYGQAPCGNNGYCAQISNPCRQIPGTCPEGEKCCQDRRKGRSA